MVKETNKLRFLRCKETTVLKKEKRYLKDQKIKR
jgi:hypothetical protein